MRQPTAKDAEFFHLVDAYAYQEVVDPLNHLSTLCGVDAFFLEKKCEGRLISIKHTEDAKTDLVYCNKLCDACFTAPKIPLIQLKNVSL